MHSLREQIRNFITPPTPPALDARTLPDQIHGAVAEVDRARAALKALQAERQHLQTAPVAGEVDLDAMADAFVELDAAVPPAVAAVDAAEARLSALERAAHQHLLQRRRDEQTRLTRLVEEAGALQKALTVREEELQRELKEIRERRRIVIGQIDDYTRQAGVFGETGVRRREAALNNGLTRDRVPGDIPIRLSEWQRLFDGARAAGAIFVEFNVNIDTGLVVGLVRPNTLPGFTVKLDKMAIGEVQR